MRKHFLPFFALAVLLVGCGEARVSSTAGFGEDDAGRPGRPGLDGGTPGPASDTDFLQEDVYRPPADELGCVLIPSVGGDIFVGVGSSVQVGAYQFSLDTGEAMIDAEVSFTILEDSVPVRLSSERVRTDGDGLAASRLTAADVSGGAVVRVFSPCANSIDIEVDVLDLPTGNLQVGFNYPFRDVYDVAPVELQVFLADDVRCREIDRGELPSVPSFREDSAPTTSHTVAFASLLVDQEYTILATGRGDFGERAAQGCADAVFVREDRTTEMTIDLFLLPLNPAGDYDVLSYWDFRDAIAESGEVGRIIVDVLDVFEDPGRGLVSFLLDLVEDFVGGIIAVAVDLFISVTGLDDLLADVINDVIESSPFLSDIVTIGRDLRAVIAELEVISELNIGKLGSDYEVFGVDQWIGLSLYWRLGCDETSPPDCGRIPIELDVADLGLLRGEWTGRVIGYDRLDIDRHPIDFEYGRLILYVLEYLVLPALTGDEGPVTLEDLMSRILNCAGIGDFVAGDGGCLCVFGACICDTDIEGFCEDFIGLVFGPIFRGFVESLSFDAVLDIRGDVDMRNIDESLTVDGLSHGQYIGNILISEAPTPFTATFCGVNQASGLDVVEWCFEERLED